MGKTRSHSFFLYSDVSKRALNSIPDPQAYWASDKGRSMRLFFEEFARSRKFHPLVPENWYNITRSDIIAAKVIFRAVRVVRVVRETRESERR